MSDCAPTTDCWSVAGAGRVIGFTLAARVNREPFVVPFLCAASSYCLFGSSWGALIFELELSGYVVGVVTFQLDAVDRPIDAKRCAELVRPGRAECGRGREAVLPVCVDAGLRCQEIFTGCGRTCQYDVVERTDKGRFRERHGDRGPLYCPPLSSLTKWPPHSSLPDDRLLTRRWLQIWS